MQVDQSDGQLNPGGPVLNAEGKVIGVATVTVLGGGMNFAIPVGQLARFLAAPAIEFEAAALNLDHCSDPTVWTIGVLPSKPSARLPVGLTASVKVTVDGKSPRIVPVSETMVSQTADMTVEVVIEFNQGAKSWATVRRGTRIVRPKNLVITPGGRVFVTPGTESLGARAGRSARPRARSGRSA